MINKITILTEPVVAETFWIKIKKFIKRDYKKVLKYGGHFAVTRSLIEGLTRLKVNYNYNPDSENEFGDVVVVLSGIEQLKRAIKYKKDNYKKIKLLAGPNLIQIPDQYHFDNILASEQIDCVLVPSEVTKLLYQKINSTLKNIISWPAGVDENYWAPDSLNIENKQNVLVYQKNDLGVFVNYVEDTIKQSGFNPIRITYGQYQHDQYKLALKKCDYAVFLSQSESQGLALAEAWAMNVPTLVWDLDKEHLFVKEKVSAAPYLTDDCGLKWREIKDLEQLLNNIKLYKFAPRQWILQNMTDKVSAQKFIEICQNVDNKL